MEKDWKPFEIRSAHTLPYSDWRMATDKLNTEKFYRSVRITAPASAFEPQKKVQTYSDPPALPWSAHYQDLLVSHGWSAEFETIIAHVPAEQAEGFAELFTNPVSNQVKNDAQKSNQVDFGPLVSARIFQPADGIPSSLPEIVAGEDDVIMAIIDDTIGFANTAFRKGPTSSRIEALWIMDARQFGDNKYGTVLYKSDIDALLKRFETDGRVDERALYRDLQKTHGIGSQFFRKTTHGTHVLDLMTGSTLEATKKDEVKVRDQQPIIAVILPRDAIKDSSGTQNEHFVEEAAKWIVWMSDKFVEATSKAPLSLPLMMNFSFGLFAGPHDGTSRLEMALHKVADRSDNEQKPLSIPFLPAGNSFQSQTHAILKFEEERPSQTLTWKIPPDNKVSSFIEIWLPKRVKAETNEGGEQSKIQLTISMPDGRTLEESKVTLNTGWEYCPSKEGEPVLSLRTYHQSIDDSVGKTRERVMIAVLPTKQPNLAKATIPAGEWKVEVTFLDAVDEGTSVIADAWIQRGGSVFGQPRLGRQSIFIDPNYRKLDTYGRPATTDNDGSAVRREGTWNALATTNGAISVGGYRLNKSDDRRGPSSYSSAASARYDNGLLDVSVVTERGAALHGIFATDTISGTRTALSGTSMACPQVARYVARRLQDGEPLDKLQAVKTHLAENATSSDSPNYSLVKLREGAGRLEVLEDMPGNKR